MSDAPERLSLSALGESSGFRGDARYAVLDDAGHAHPPAGPGEDPVALAWSDGFAAGLADARGEAEVAALGEAQARAKLDLAFARLDRELAETLRRRLGETVAALCEAALAPLALDREALALRIGRAVALFQRADDERVLRLHPDDLALVSAQLPPDWRVTPDPALERGALRIETASGGVEDGPGQWRQAIAQALDQC